MGYLDSWWFPLYQYPALAGTALYKPWTPFPLHSFSKCRTWHIGLGNPHYPSTRRLTYYEKWRVAKGTGIHRLDAVPIETRILHDGGHLPENCHLLWTNARHPTQARPAPGGFPWLHWTAELLQTSSASWISTARNRLATDLQPATSGYLIWDLHNTRSCTNDALGKQPIQSGINFMYSTSAYNSN